jgi:CBS domain-containing protein
MIDYAEVVRGACSVRSIGGRSGPVVDGEELVGIVTRRDLRFETRFDAPV